MPIHDQSYRHYRGTRENSRSAWTVIATTGIKSFLRRRAFMGVLIFGAYWIGDKPGVGAYAQPRSGTGLVAHPVFKTGRPS